MWGSLLVIFGLLSLLYWLLVDQPGKRSRAMVDTLPGPKRLPVIGNMWLLRHGPEKLLGTMSKLFKDFGPVIRLWFGDNAMVFIAHPDDAQCVLGKAQVVNHPEFMSVITSFFVGDSVMFQRDNVWKRHRKLISPQFSFKILETYVDVFARKARNLVETLDRLPDRQSFDVHKYLCYCTLEAIFATTIGSTEVPKNFSENAPGFIKEILGILFNRIQLYLILPRWAHWMLSTSPHTRQLIKSLKMAGEAVISEKIRAYRNGARDPSFTTSAGNKIMSLMDIAIECSETEGTRFSEKETLDDMLTLGGAGMETSATAMSFCLLLLAINPDMQEQVRMEMVDIFGDDTRLTTNDDVTRMLYLDRVIKETLRLFPIAPILTREIPEDLRLPSGHTLPKGCDVSIITFATHRLEEYYPEPHKFWPDRWLPENSTTHNPYAYLPFGAGQRNCIGRRYAMLQMKTVLSTLLRRYHVTTHYKMADLDKLDATYTLSLAWPQKYQIQLKKLM